MTLSGYDAAFPPAPPPPDQVVMGYIGGDTPHVWSLGDWESQPARFRIPIWTRDNPGGYSGFSEAQAALTKLDSLGAPHGIYVVIDYELAIDASYVQQFDSVMQSVGNKVALYGSKSTVFQNPKPSGGYFPADITDAPHLYPGTVMTQYEFEGNWDDDTIASGLSLWDTQLAPPAPPTPPKEPEMILLTGMNGTDVWGLSGRLYWHVMDGTAVSGYRNAGVPEATIDAAEHAAILAAVAAENAAVSLTDAQVAALGQAIAANVHFPTHVSGTETTTVTDTLS